MIFDQLTNAGLYAFSNPRLLRGLQFLQSSDIASRAPGRYEIEGDQLFAMVQEYPTKPEAHCFWEAHRKFIDIQYVVDGIERMGFSPLGSLTVSQPYDELKDFMKLVRTSSGQPTMLEVPGGYFAIFFPHDAH